MDNKNISVCPICSSDDSPLPVAHGHSIDGNYVSSRDLQLLAETKEVSKTTEPTQAQINRQDEVDNACFELIVTLAPADARGSKNDVPWDIELITLVREAVQEVIVDRLQLMKEEEFYP